MPLTFYMGVEVEKGAENGREDSILYPAHSAQDKCGEGADRTPELHQ